jgi:ubiquitin-protein ligase
MPPLAHAQWNAIIEGPKETPFEGGSFALAIEFPADYPIRPPTVKFVTPVFHPNVTKEGGICLNLLKEDWKPLITMPALLSSIRLLLATPNMEVRSYGGKNGGGGVCLGCFLHFPLPPTILLQEALHVEAVELFRKSPEEYEAKAREWTAKYGKPE